MNLFSTAALALTIIAVTAGAASAATFAYADQDAKVRMSHKNQAPTVNWIAEGQKVKVIDSFGNWYKIQIPGKDGWVKANTLDFVPNWKKPNWKNADYDSSFCVGDVNAKFCINANY